VQIGYFSTEGLDEAGVLGLDQEERKESPTINSSLQVTRGGSPEADFHVM